MFFLIGTIIGFIGGVAFSLLSLLVDLKLKYKGLSPSIVLELLKPKAQVILKEDTETVDETLDRLADEDD